MSGNAWEWCEDSYHPDYAGAPSDGSPWIAGGEKAGPHLLSRVLRGGNLLSPADGCRSSHRYKGDPNGKLRIVGFRPAFSNPDD